jgi:hypothetical protein
MADQISPAGVIAARRPSILVMTLALLLAALLGAGLMFAGWAVFGDEDAVVVPQASAPATTTPHVTTAAEVASAQALDRVKHEAATAAAIGRSDITSEQAAAPTSSLAGVTAPAAKAEAKVHADTMRGLSTARNNVAGTPASGAAAVSAGTVVGSDQLRAAKIQAQQFQAAGAAAK